MWSILFTTGYLTYRGTVSNGIYQLAIPNLEIKQIFIEQIQKWFESHAIKDTPTLDAFCLAFENADTLSIENQMNQYLKRIVGIHDYSIRQELKENYYHGLLVGLLRHREDWALFSNTEAGNGYSDILVENDDKLLGIAIEVKCPKDGSLDAGCDEAMAQIETNEYEDRLLNDGMENIIKIGIAFYKKKCKVVSKIQ